MPVEGDLRQQLPMAGVALGDGDRNGYVHPLP
jgi:hypothetical protein